MAITTVRGTRQLRRDSRNLAGEDIAERIILPHQIDESIGTRQCAVRFNGATMSFAALVRLFKIGQLFQSAKGYPMRNRKPRRCCMNQTKDRSRIEFAIAVKL